MLARGRDGLSAVSPIPRNSPRRCETGPHTSVPVAQRTSTSLRNWGFGFESRWGFLQPCHAHGLSRDRSAVPALLRGSRAECSVVTREMLVQFRPEQPMGPSSNWEGAAIARRKLGFEFPWIHLRDREEAVPAGLITRKSVVRINLPLPSPRTSWWTDTPHKGVVPGSEPGLGTCVRMRGNTRIGPI